MQVVPLDFRTAEGELRQHDLAVPPDMDDYFDREWARTLFTLAIDRLRAHYAGGRERYFRVFERYDLEATALDKRVTDADLAGELGIKPTDVTNYLAAARRQFRAFVLDRLRELTDHGRGVPRRGEAAARSGPVTPWLADRTLAHLRALPDDLAAGDRYELRDQIGRAAWAWCSVPSIASWSGRSR